MDEGASITLFSTLFEAQEQQGSNRGRQDVQGCCEGHLVYIGNIFFPCFEQVRCSKGV
jgi:hypothetical protein